MLNILLRVMVQNGYVIKACFIIDQIHSYVGVLHFSMAWCH